MDPDSTAVVSDSKTVSSDKPISGDDFTNPAELLAAFFPDFKEDNSVISGVTPSITAMEQNGMDHLSPGKFQEESQIGNVMNGHTPVFEENTEKGEELKQQMKDLKEKNIMLESQIADYEDRLSQKMREVLSAKVENDNIIEHSEIKEQENSSLKSKVEQLEAELYQYRELNLKYANECQDKLELQKDLVTKEKLFQKLKNDHDASNGVSSERNINLKKMKRNNRRLWNLLTKFGETLSSAGLLSAKEKNVIMKEYDEENPVPEYMIEDAIAEKDTPLHDSASANQITHLNPASDNYYVPESKPSTVTSSARPRVINNSNYFLKSVRDVMEDSNFSDGPDGSISELEEIRKQVCVRSDHFVPISPLPPTPPPKHFQPQARRPSGINTLHAKTMYSSPACKESLPSEPSPKRRPFLHQQSEGFDIPAETSFNKQEALNGCNNASAVDDKKYRLYLKRGLDGNIKLDINNPAPLRVEFDLATENISLTFVRSENDTGATDYGLSKNAKLEHSFVPNPISMDRHADSYANTAEPYEYLNTPHKKPRLSVDNLSTKGSGVSAFQNESSAVGLEEKNIKILDSKQMYETMLQSPKADNRSIVTSSCENSPSKKPLFLSPNKLHLLPVRSKKSKKRNTDDQNAAFSEQSNYFAFKKSVFEIGRDAGYSSSDSDRSTDIQRLKVASLKATPRQRKKRSKSALSDSPEKLPETSQVRAQNNNSGTRMENDVNMTNDFDSENDSTRLASEQMHEVVETLVLPLLPTDASIGGALTETKSIEKGRNRASYSKQAQFKAGVADASVNNNSVQPAGVLNQNKSVSPQRQMSFNAQDFLPTDNENSTNVSTNAASNQLSEVEKLISRKITRKRSINKLESETESRADMLNRAKEWISCSLKVKKEDTGLTCTTGLQNAVMRNGGISNGKDMPLNSQHAEECADSAEVSVPAALVEPNKRTRRVKVKKEPKDDYEPIFNTVPGESKTVINTVPEKKRLGKKIKTEKQQNDTSPSPHEQESNIESNKSPPNCNTQVMRTPIKNGPSTFNNPSDNLLKNGDPIDFSQLDVGFFNPSVFTAPSCFESPFKDFKTDSPASPTPETNLEYNNSASADLNENERNIDFFTSLELSPKKAIQKSNISTDLSGNSALQNGAKLRGSMKKESNTASDSQTGINNSSARDVKPKIMDAASIQPDVGVEIEIETENPKPKRRKRRGTKGFRLEETTDTEVENGQNISLTNGHTVNGNVKKSEIDSDSDNPLCIVEELPENPDCKAESESAHSDNTSFNETTTGKKVTRRKKRKGPKWSTARKTKKKEVPESGVSITTAFNTLEKMKFTDQHFKLNVHNLVSVLINPANIESLKKLIFYVIGHLCDSRKNPFLSFSQSSDPSTLLPLTENCIVTALFQIEKKNKPCLKGLLDGVVKNLSDMIVGKAIFTIYGQSSLCRVLAEICKRRNDKRTLHILISDLLRRQHKFTPFFIASIVGLWNDLLQPSANSDEERVFFSSITYAMHSKPGTLTETQWKLCKNVLDTYLTVEAPEDLMQNIKFLADTIPLKCFQEEYENAFMLITPLAVFAQVQGYKWAQTWLLDNFVLTWMHQITTENWNKEAFRVCCDINAEVCVLFPPKSPDAYEVLNHLFRDPDHQDDDIHFRTAIALLKLYTIRMEYLPDDLVEWAASAELGKNSEPDSQVKELESLFQRRNIHLSVFNKSEIIVPNNEKNAGHN